MDLFTLVARLTLDSDDYEKSLKKTERDAKHTHIDATGTITATDQYSEPLHRAEREAKTANLDADGELTLDSTDFQKGITNAKSNAGDFESYFQGVTQGLATALTAAGIVGAIKAISTAFVQAIDNAAQTADAIDKGAQALGISTKAYQEWKYVLGQSGASMSTVTRGFRNIKEAAAGSNEEVVAALAALDINPSAYKSTEALFNDVIESLTQLPDSIERDNLVTAIFGPNGTQLNALFNGTTRQIYDLKKEARDLGLIMSNEDIANGVAFGDAVAAMNEGIEALKTNISANLFPVLTQAVLMVTDLVKWLNGGDDTILDDFSEIDERLANAFGEINSEEADTNFLIKRLKEMSDETGKCKTNMDDWLAIAQKLVDKCPDLAKQIDFVSGSFDEQTGSLEENAKAWFANARAQAVASATQEKLDAIEKEAADIASAQLNIELERNRLQSSQQRKDLGTKIWEQVVDKYGTNEQKRSYSRWKLENDMSYSELDTLVSQIAGEHGWSASDMFYGITNEIGQGVYLEKLLERGENDLKKRQALLDEAIADYQDTLKMLDEMTKEAQELTLFQAPAGDTQKGWENLRKVLETYYGRYISRGALQTLANSGQRVPQQLENADFSANDIQVDGNSVIINGDIVVDITPTMDSLFGGLNGPHAKGLWSVPYNDYIARLDQEEMILTASQAREYRDGGGANNSAVVAAIQSLSHDMQNLKIYVGKKVFGQTVVDYSGKRMNGYLGKAEDRTIAGYGWG